MRFTMFRNNQKTISKIQMTKDGKVLSEEEYKRATIRRQQRWAARQQLAHKMAMDARDSHLGRQLELQKQLQAVSRVETYRKMRVS